MSIGRSILTVTSAARSRQLITLSAVKDRLGLSDSSQDAKLTRLINEASQQIAGDGYLARPPWREACSVQLGGYGNPRLYLPRWPIESVTSVTKDGATVAATTYSIAGEHRDHLYREDGWDWTAQAGSLLTEDRARGTEELLYAVAFVGGWIMPGQIADWAADTATTEGSWVRASDPTVTLRFEATAVVGDTKTHATDEPTWPTTAGDTVTDDQVTWTARDGRELPADLERLAWLLVQRSYHEESANPLVQSIAKGGASITYATTNIRRQGIDEEAARICAQYR
jgi:hypothetical protein